MKKATYKPESSFKIDKTNQVTCSTDIYKMVKGDMCEHQEHFTVLYLNNKNVVLNKKVVGIGTTASCQVSPRDVIRPAIVQPGIVRLVLVHNHPSGDCTPSPEDVALTKKLAKGCKLFDLAILDHIIIGSGYASLRDLGLF